MTREEFSQLVQRIERQYAGHPQALARTVNRWAWLGYAAVVGWLGLLFSVGAGVFVLGIMLPLEYGSWFCIPAGGALLAWAAIQTALLVMLDVELPKGERLDLRKFPELRRLMHDLRLRLRCEKFDTILLVSELNAAVLQVPRLGVFGWSRRYLLLGLPLLQILSPEQFQAVLAHEFAHLSARDARQGSRLYHLRQTWEGLVERINALGEQGQWKWLGQLMQWFVAWYWPRFNALAFVHSRFQEYAADAVAAEFYGPETSVQALWRIKCGNYFLNQRFAIDLWKPVATQSTPPGDFIEQLRDAWPTAQQAADRDRWVSEICSQLTDRQDTHPSMTDRARALGLTLQSLREQGYPAPPSVSAAEFYLGEQLPTLEKAVSTQFQRDVIRNWRDQHTRHAVLNKRLAELDLDPHPDDPRILWERARTISDLQDMDAAQPILERLLQVDPQHVWASYVLGQHLLARGETIGETWLLKLLDGRDSQVATQACEVLVQHYRLQGDQSRWEEMTRRLHRFEKTQASQQKQVTTRDEFLPHGLSDQQLQALRNVLTQGQAVTGAWLALKRQDEAHEQPLFVLCLHGAKNWRGAYQTEADEATLRTLRAKIELPGRVLLMTPGGLYARLARKLMRNPQAMLDLTISPITS